MARSEEHLRELLKLPVEQRADAAKRLLDSLDTDGDDLEAESLKVDELVRRARAVQSGTTDLVDAGEARKRALARLRAIRGE